MALFKKRTDMPEKVQGWKADEEINYKVDWPTFFHGDRLYQRISEAPLGFFIIDNKEECMEKCLISKEDKKGKRHEHKKVIVANFAVDELVLYEPIEKDFTPQYGIKIRKNKRKHEFRGELQEVLGEINTYAGYFVKPRESTEIFGRIVSLFEAHKKLMVKKEPTQPGFYWIDKKLVSTKDYIDPSATEVRKALELLEDFCSYFMQFKEQVSFCLHWMLLAPFSFARRQKGTKDIQNALYLYGTSGAGKSTIALLSSHIWDIPIIEADVGAGLLHSQASYGRSISQNTYPIIIDEAEGVFDPKNAEIGRLFKTSIFKTVARGRYSPLTGRYEKILSLSPQILTSNIKPPSDGAIGARFYNLDFFTEKPRKESEMNAFEGIFLPPSTNGPLQILKHLGNFVGCYVLANPELIDMEWKESSKILMEALYEYGGRPLPEWLSEVGEAKGREEAWKAEDDAIINRFTNLILRKADPNVFDEDRKQKNYLTVIDKVNDVIKMSREPWIYYHSPNKGTLAGKEYVIATGGIEIAFEKEYGIAYSRKVLAQKLGGDDTRLNNRRVIRWEYREFLKLFDSGDE
jgi:hypothetical protein